MLMFQAKDHRSDNRYKKKIAIFGAAAATTAALSVYGLVQNGNGAVARYNALVAVDQAGGDVGQALNDLRGFIYSHMNAEIGGPNGIYPPIQLNGTYQRLVAAEEQRVADANDELYAEAQDYCEQFGSQGFSGGSRVECINSYVDEHGAKVQSIDESFYKYDFVAPRWSPDLAGFSLILCALFTGLTLVYLLRYLHTRHLVRMSS